jgi:hypothetical protein
VLLFFVIPIVGGAKRGLEKRAQGNEVIAAMELFEPETARQARAVEKDLARVKPLIQGAMMRAAKRAPDAELVAYGDALFQLVETPTGINQPRCVSMATGGSKVPPTMAEEMHVAKATARLFRAAATQPVPVPIDLDRAMSLRDQALKAADPEGLISDPASFAAMPPDQQCGFYLRMMKALRQLPEKDAALILRFNMSQAG